jgi:hypothetical protein
LAASMEVACNMGASLETMLWLFICKVKKYN